jgi:hypothetical protein
LRFLFFLFFSALQNLLDALKFSVEQISANSSHPEKTIKARKLIEYLLIDINEYSIARCGTVPRHVHGQAVADPFAGDDLYGVDMSLLTHERVEKAKKQVAKDRANATLAAAARGVSAGGKKKSGGRGRGGKHQQQQQQRQPYNNSQHLGGMGRGGGGGNGGATGGFIGGATGGYQAPVCYGCGASGHIQRNYPNNK